MQWLIIKTTSLKSEKADYALLTQNSEYIQFTTSNWQAIKEHIGNCRAVLLIPSEEVGLHQVTLPMANNKQMSKAIPFALEDALAEDIEQLHFSFYRNPASSVDNAVNVATMNAERLQQWQDTLKQERGIKLHAILPDLFALPADEKNSSLLVEQTRALYRHDTFSGTSCSPDLLPLLLPSFLVKQPNSKNDQDTTSRSTLLLDKPNELILDFPEHIDAQTSSLEDSCHSSLLSALPLNLLTGFGKNEQEALLKQLSKWKAVAILAGLVATLWLVTTGIQNYRAQQHLQQLNDALTTVFKETFPDATIDTDYRVNHQVMEEKLNALGIATPKTPSALEPLALVTPIIKKNRAINLKKLTIDNNELILAITAGSVTQLERFNAAINRHAALQAEIKSQNTSDNKVVATLNVRPKKP